MTRNIIADSSGLVSLISQTDQNHRIAQKVIRNLMRVRGIILIPAEVFAETLNILGKKINKDTVLKANNIIKTSKVFFIGESNSTIRAKAIEKLKDQSSSVSFTDCLVMAFADEQKTKDIFGFDEDFKKSGYRRLAVDVGYTLVLS